MHIRLQSLVDNSEIDSRTSSSEENNATEDKRTDDDVSLCETFGTAAVDLNENIFVVRTTAENK